jgi:Fic family protein
MEILLSILIIVSSVLGYVSYNLLRKNEKYEDIIESYIETSQSYEILLTRISDTIKQSDQKLKEIDSKGMFESDDEVGFFFEQIKTIQNELNSFQLID